MHVIEAEGLVKTYPVHRGLRRMLRHPFTQPQHRVLDGLCCRLEAGEILGVLGANGEGKTTLLKILAGLLLPTEGSVKVNGMDLRTAASQARASVSYCFSEDRSFYWRLTGRQNLEFFAALDDLHGSLARDRIAGLAARLRIGDYLDRPFAHYSSGIRQRFALARALLRSPSILLLDEPTRSIDPGEARNIWTFLRDDLVGQQGLSIVVVTHQPGEALAVSDRVVRLAAGKLRTDLPEALPVPNYPRAEERAGKEREAGVSDTGGFTLILEGLPAFELTRLQGLPGIRELTLNECDGKQHLDVCCVVRDLAIAELVAATTSAGARILSLTTTPEQVSRRAMRTTINAD